MQFLPMRLLLAAVPLIAVSSTITIATTSDAQNPVPAPATAQQTPAKLPTPPAKPKCATGRKHNRYVARVLRFSNAGGNYVARKITQRQIRKAGRMRACAKKHYRARYKWMKRVWKSRISKWRFHRHIDVITPYGEWAIPPPIVMCESGGNYRAFNKSGSGASGAYQIMPGTWSRWGGHKWASQAAHAPPHAQHIVAGRIMQGQGRGAWVC